MSRLDDLKASLKQAVDRVRESDAYTQLRARYDELDVQKKLYIKLGVVAASVLLVIGSVFGGLVRVASLKSNIDEKEALIGYLNQTADTLKQLRQRQASPEGNADLSGPLNVFVESVVEDVGIDEGKRTVSAESVGDQDKTTQEVTVDVKLSDVNLRQVTKALFEVINRGSTRGVTVTSLDIRARDDFSGWMDASFTVSLYKAK